MRPKNLHLWPLRMSQEDLEKHNIIFSIEEYQNVNNIILKLGLCIKFVEPMKSSVTNYFLSYNDHYKKWFLYNGRPTCNGISVKTICSLFKTKVIEVW